MRARVTSGRCIKAMPQLNALTGQFEGRPVAVLGMNTDRDPTDAKFVVDKMGLDYTTLKIEFDDNALRSLPVGGTFQTNPDGVEALLTMLHDGFGTTIRRDNQGHVHIEGPAK